MSSLIVVDIQPAYEDHIGFSIPKFVEYLNNFEGNILYLYNGESLGMDHKGEIIDWLYDVAEEAIPEEDWEKLQDFHAKLINDVEFFDKDYGFFRDLMDSGWDVDDMVTLARYMLTVGPDIRDARDIDFDGLREQNLLEEEQIDELESEEFMFYIPELANAVAGWGGSTLVGGGEYECLAEVEIMLTILDEPYTVNRQFVY